MQNGTYRAKPLGAALGVANTGNEQVGIEFQLLDEPGGNITYYGTFTEKAAQHTIKALRVSGWRGEDLSDLSSIGADTALEVHLVIENEEYQGTVRAKVKWVNASGGLAFKTPLTGDGAKAFAARMRGAVLAFDKSAGQPKPNSRTGAQPPEPPHPASDVDYDDVPF